MKAVFIVLLLSINSSPQSFLFAGEKALQSGNWQEASINLQAALDTGELNDGGQAVTYWNLHIAEHNLKRADKDMEALLGFIVYGSMFEELQGPQYRRWKKIFGLKQKLAYAIALIQSTWANRNDYSCRSEVFSCYIVSRDLIHVFAQVIPFCPGQKIKNMQIIRSGSILKTNIKCSTGNETYYFTTKNY